MRKIFWILSFVVVLAIALLYPFSHHASLVIGLIFAPLFLIGLNDMKQTRHAVRRNFPIIGNFRYLFELIRPEIQQYFVEDNTSGRPINRNMRSVVYQRAKKVLQTQPFGTQENVYQEGNEWVCHSMYPTEVKKDFDRVVVGGPLCKQPYSCSRLNISAMSYGSLSKNAVIALNLGAKEGKFYHNTGEGGISPYHLFGADLVWQIGTGYFGCRNSEGRFCQKTFAEKSKKPEVKMIEIKVSQGAKPGKGGMLPGAKVTAEIAEIRGVDIGQDVNSPAKHREFSDAKGLLQFVQLLRDLSGGKPVGFKICVGKKEEFQDVVKTMKETQILPDFISVDGSEGGTGAAPIEFANAVGMPLKDGLSFVDSCLKEEGLRKDIRIIASGKSLTGFHMIKNFALGADIVSSARGMMLSLGCIQALQCHSNHCPVGITTNNPQLVKGLVIDRKWPRVKNYHEETLKAVKSLLTAMGKQCPEELERSDIYQRQGDGTYKTFSEIYH